MNRKFVFSALLVVLLSAPSSAFAFCGFYVSGGNAKLFNEATQVVLMRNGTKTVLSMQNNYEGPPKNFAMVVPVPMVLHKKNVKTLDKTVFDRVDTMTAPRLVEYWEQDPCRPPMVEEDEAVAYEKGGAIQKEEKKVKVEAKFKVGEYDVVILSAEESTALNRYLKQQKYNIPKGAEPYFKPYIDSGMYFFVAKVDAKKVKYKDGHAVLSPLRFAYESKTFSLPIRLGMINSRGKQDLLVYILSQGQRYQVANYPNVFIPTNIDVKPSVKTEFPSFYRSLFDRTVEENPGAVVTEYSWQASSCDPCPGPTLTQNDFMTLGADEFKGLSQWNWVITRLHARYSKGEIGKDLVFEKAPPVMGGRETRDKDGALQKGATPASTNNFQGRYVIRHEWQGKADCKNPQFGIWGGPNGRDSQPAVRANQSPNTRGGTATVAAKPRKLETYLKKAIQIPKASGPNKPNASVTVKPVADSPATPTPDSKAPTSGEKPAPPTDTAPKNRCSVAMADTAAPAASLLGLLLGLVFLRRRRR